MNFLQKISNNNIYIVSSHILNKKQCAERRFADFGQQIRELVAERQQVNIKIEGLNKDIVLLEEGNRGLRHLLTSQDPSFAFLDLDTEWDPQKVKGQMLDFKELINKNKDKFCKEPIGPLFSCLAVKNNQLCKLIEKILSPHLCTFVVDNIQDEMVLKGLVTAFKGHEDALEQLTDVSPQIRILVVPFLKNYEPVPRLRIMERLTFSCTNMLEALKFKMDEAETWKIAVGKELNAENLFLFETEHDAFIFMHAQSSLLPTTRVLAYSLDGYQIFPFPEFKTAAIRVPKQASFLHVDQSDDIRFLNATVAELIESRKLYDKAINNLRLHQLAALAEWEGEEIMDVDPNNNNNNNSNQSPSISTQLIFPSMQQLPNGEKCQTTSL